MAVFVKGCLTIVDLSHRRQLFTRDETHPLRLKHGITQVHLVQGNLKGFCKVQGMEFWRDTEKEKGAPDRCRTMKLAPRRFDPASKRE